jgi:hypothetical protein
LRAAHLWGHLTISGRRISKALQPLAISGDVCRNAKRRAAAPAFSKTLWNDAWPDSPHGKQGNFSLRFGQALFPQKKGEKTVLIQTDFQQSPFVAVPRHVIQMVGKQI